jgi:sugar lactone lactonase YvrE
MIVALLFDILNNSGLFYNPPTTPNIDIGVVCQVQINKCKIGNRRRFVGKIGEPASFLLEVRDINGQLTHLPNDCAISCLMDDTEVNTQITLKEKGNYKISFVPQNPGPHTVTCLIGSEHVNGSPFVCRVLPTSLLHHIKLIDNLDIPVGVAFTRQTNHTILAERGTRASNISILNERGEKIKSLGNQEFHTLSGVALDKEDNLFIVDSGRGCLCKYSMEGDNMAAVGIFDLPYSVAVHPNGTIFITERNNYRIQVFNQDLTFSYSFGSKGTQRGKFKVLFDIAIDSKGYVYASDPKLHRVQKFDELGNYVSSIQVNSPYFLSFDGQDILYVMEQRESLKQFFAVRPIFVVHHHFITIINCRGDDMMMLDEFQWSMYCPDYGCASNIAVNREGLLHICDPHNNCIYIC